MAAHIAVAAGIAGIEHTEGGNGFEALVGLRGLNGITTAAANAEQSQMFAIRARILADVIGGSANVLNAVLRLVGITRFATAGALVGGIEGNSDIAFFRQLLCVQSGDLLFDAAIGMGDDNGRIFFCRVVTGRRINIRRDFYAGLFLRVFHRMNIYLAGFVLCNCPGIGKGKGVVFVVISHAVFSKSECHCGGQEKDFAVHCSSVV